MLQSHLFIKSWVGANIHSMRLDRLHRAYPSLHLFGVVHWVPVLSNIKTATGCESNRQLQLWTVFAGTVVYNYQFNGIQGWAGHLCQIHKMSGCHLANAWRSRSKHILQWRYYTAMKYQFNSIFEGYQVVCPSCFFFFQYLELDLEFAPEDDNSRASRISMFSSIQPDRTEYKEIDYEKTRALTDTRVDREMQRKSSDNLDCWITCVLFV